MMPIKKFMTAIVAAFSLLACGGSGGNKTTPVSNPPSSITYGIFRALQPKVTPLIPGVSGSSSQNQSVTMTVSRVGSKYMQLSNGTVAIIGGDNISFAGQTGLPPSVIDIFDPSTETFSRSPITTTVWRGHDSLHSFGICQLSTDKFLMIGGNLWMGQNTCEVVDFNNQTCVLQNISSLPVIESTDYLFNMGNNKILLLNGRQLSGIWINYGSFIIDTTTWSATPINIMDPSLMAYSAIQLGNNDVIISGGTSDIKVASSNIYRVSASDLSVTNIGQMTVPRFAHAMVLLPNNQIDIIGGIQDNSIPGSTIRLSSTEILDLNKDTTTPSVSLLKARSFITPVMLQNGFILNAGGSNEIGVSCSDEFIHDPISGVVGTTGNLIDPRRFYCVVPISGGRVLIAGGEAGISLSSNTAEIYDPQMKIAILYITDHLQVSEKESFTTNSNNKITWSVTLVSGGDPGSIDATGLYTAPNTPANVKIIATDNSNGNTASAEISVN